MRPKKIPNIHPGKILNEEFLIPMKISMYRLAKDTSVSPIRISEIVRGKRAITPDTAIRLGKYFNMSAEFWINLQADYDIEEAKNDKDRIEKEVTPYTSSKGKAPGKNQLKAKIALHR